jgi:stage III sporulation protein AH
MNFSSSSELAKSSNSIGDVELVSSMDALVENNETEESRQKEDDENDKEEKEDDDENEEEKEDDDDDEKNSGNLENVSTSASNTKDFSELRLERDNMYSKSLETYQKIVDSGISNDQKAIAIQEIEKINTVQNEIKIAEELIKLKDFEDVIIYKNDDSVSVIVRCAALSTSQVAQIQNIVSRELAVDVRKY